jgi:fructose-1,6-bisphosphatase I
MYSFNHTLREQNTPSDVRSILYHIARGVKYINFSLRAGNTGAAKSQNSSGEDQLTLDVLSDKIIIEQLEYSQLVACCASEEQEELMYFPAPRGKYTVAYDPLDGSSLVGANLTIGSIFGIWEGSELVGKKGRDLVASAYAIYGPRVELIVALKGKGVFIFEMNDVGEFMLTQQKLDLKDTSKYFAPGNLRATAIHPEYLKLVEGYIAEGRTLRYSGGMVPDLHHILKKGEGIFTYPGCSKHPNGKLRLAFECAPFAMIFAEAGGLALDVHGTDILDLEIKEQHERTTIFIGSSDEVKNAVKALQ